MDDIGIEFDIDLAKLAIVAETGKITTRDGRDVKLSNLFTVDLKSPSLYPLKGVIIYSNFQEGEEDVWTLEGKYTVGGGIRELDLIIKEL